MKPADRSPDIARAPHRARGGGAPRLPRGEPHFLSVNDLGRPKGDRVPDWLVAEYARLGTACPRRRTG